MRAFLCSIILVAVGLACKVRVGENSSLADDGKAPAAEKMICSVVVNGETAYEKLELNLQPEGRPEHNFISNDGLNGPAGPFVSKNRTKVSFVLKSDGKKIAFEIFEVPEQKVLVGEKSEGQKVSNTSSAYTEIPVSTSGKAAMHLRTVYSTSVVECTFQ